MLARLISSVNLIKKQNEAVGTYTFVFLNPYFKLHPLWQFLFLQLYEIKKNAGFCKIFQVFSHDYHHKCKCIQLQ